MISSIVHEFTITFDDIKYNQYDAKMEDYICNLGIHWNGHNLWIKSKSFNGNSSNGKPNCCK